MRVKSVPRKVKSRKSGKSNTIKIAGKSLEIFNVKVESSKDLKIPAGMDLSTKKESFENEVMRLLIGTKRIETSLPTPPRKFNPSYNTIPEVYMIQDDYEDPEPVRQNKFEDSFLYQIMTDPKLMEKMQESKNKKKLSCQFCRKEFETEAELEAHLSSQFDDSNRATCCACKKTFAQKRYLRYHQRCHSDQSKYSCDICLKKYSRLDNLTRHNILHTNPDKFPCTTCDRAFARKDLLNKHQKSHENKLKYHCSMCQKFFKGPLSLNNHMKTFHSPETESDKSRHNSQTQVAYFSGEE